MPASERVIENLNRALRALFERDEQLYLLGQDIADPYGGAFRATRQLSTRYPDRVIATPISESAMVGVASGLALCGNRVIVEIMFGDFAALAFDQVLNFAAKSVAMYGRRRPMPVLLRCPAGGNRGYGPTHSQSLQKHFMGIPQLSLHELSPFHDAEPVLTGILDRGEPAILFEPKELYGEFTYRDGRVDDLLTFRMLPGGWAHIHPPAIDGPAVVLIVPGGVSLRALDAARSLALEDNVQVHVVIPAQLYPLDLDPVQELLARATAVCVAEEGTAGGTWGAEVARHVHERLWGRLARPVRLVSSLDSIIPAAPHLERKVLVQADTIRAALRSLVAVPAPARPGESRSPVAGGPLPSAPDPDRSRADVIAVPKLNNNDAAYVLLRWLVADGEQVAPDCPVAEIETSKAIEELVAATRGTLRVLVAEGESCRPGDVIAQLAGAGDQAPWPSSAEARERPGPAPETVPLSRAQRMVADVVAASHRDIPDAFVLLRVKIDSALALQHSSAGAAAGPVGLLEMLIMTVAELRPRFPACFGALAGAGTAMRLAEEANIGVTLDAGHGLFVPVIRSADYRSAAEIGDDLAAFRLQALRGTFSENDLTGANILISWNYENDVSFVQPLIPPGLACAISAGGPRAEVTLSESGQLATSTIVSIGLAHDHRLVNGREAVAFLHAISGILRDENRLASLVARSSAARSSKAVAHG